MVLAKWTITAKTDFENLTEYQHDDLLDTLAEYLDVDLIEYAILKEIDYLRPYGIDIEVMDG